MSNTDGIPSVRGTVISFNRDTCVGEVQYDLTVLRFHSTSFHGRSWPRIGQEVEIVFTDSGELVALHEHET